ncbi:hypothetical protein [Dactylosporangium sp. CA-139066]|uniref:hypothetical protein n=1 Tax=Dactylosporangium sp. CA-139066 TaxID=3239930 RepID=UPI003D8B3CF9
MRRFGMALAAATATAITGAMLAPAPAYAADPPTVNWAHSVNDDLGRLEVAASAESGVASIKAHIISYATQQEVAATDQFNLSSGTEQDGVWVTAERFQIPQLGGYRVDVEVTDRDGQHVLQPYAGDLAYGVATFIDQVKVQPAAMTYYKRDVTLSGRLNGRWPGDGHVEALSGFPMQLSSYPGDFTEVTTGAGGKFSGVLHLQQAGTVYAYYSYDNDHLNYYSSNTDQLPVALNPAASRATVKLSKARINAGDTITVSGQFQWHSKDGWQPLANKQFGLLFCPFYQPDNCNPVSFDYPTTDADGRFSIQVTPYSSGHYQVGLNPNDPFIATVIKPSADLVVLQPSSFSEFNAARNPDGTVSVSGKLKFGNFSPGVTPVQIQYSPTGRSTDWTTVSTIQADGGYNFNTTIESAQPGYWRAYYPGQTDLFRPATSPKIQVA